MLDDPLRNYSKSFCKQFLDARIFIMTFEPLTSVKRVGSFVITEHTSSIGESGSVTSLSFPDF